MHFIFFHMILPSKGNHAGIPRGTIWGYLIFARKLDYGSVFELSQLLEEVRKLLEAYAHAILNSDSLSSSSFYLNIARTSALMSYFVNKHGVQVISCTTFNFNPTGYEGILQKR